MFPPTYISCDYGCVTFVSLFINLRHPRDFTSHTSRRGTLYIYTWCAFWNHRNKCWTSRTDHGPHHLDPNLPLWVYRICAVQIQPRQYVLDHAYNTAPTRQHKLYHTDQESMVAAMTYLDHGVDWWYARDVKCLRWIAPFQPRARASVPYPTHQLLLLHCADHNRASLRVRCQVLPGHDAAAACLAKCLHVDGLQLALGARG